MTTNYLDAVVLGRVTEDAVARGERRAAESCRLARGDAVDLRPQART